MTYTVTKGQHISRYCMVCGVENQFGLKTRFYETEEQELVALFTPREEHQSYPGIAHGGVSAALLDEVIGRAIMIHHDQETFGVTMDLQVKYRKPVPLGVELRAVARITRDSGSRFAGSGELYLPDGSVAVSAEGKYLKRRVSDITTTEFMDNEWFAPDGELPEEINL